MPRDMNEGGLFHRRHSPLTKGNGNSRMHSRQMPTKYKEPSTKVIEITRSPKIHKSSNESSNPTRIHKYNKRMGKGKKLPGQKIN